MEVPLNLDRLDLIDRYAELGLDRVIYLVSATASGSEMSTSVRDLGRIAGRSKA
jgi:hypothetical protein